MLTLRPMQPQDLALVVTYIKELATYERDPDAAVVTLEDLRRFALKDDPLIYVLMAEWSGQSAGFALWFLNFSTWEGKPGIYLEDLYIRPSFRNQGIGKAIMIYLARLAHANNYSRIVWQVLDWNETSIAFYEKIRGKKMQDWLTYRLSSSEIHQLAEQKSELLP